MNRLNSANLGQLPSDVQLPRYDRAALKPGIIHLGIGAFHRAHQAYYTEAVLNQFGGDWGIIGCSLRSANVREQLAPQDNLYTLVERSGEGEKLQLIGAVVKTLVGPEDPVGLVTLMADPAIRIVSLTITEGGYYIDPASQRFDPQHKDMVADATSGAVPRTVFGLILAGLQRRRAAGVAPFTVMSCDNIPGNGEVTRNAVVGLAQAMQPELAAWVKANVSFPNGMVDRITPATSDRERQLLAEEFGIADNWPVFCERFRQWVVEDEFPAGRPALERVGVQFVPDVAPFELMKIRILNGGHATIAYPAALMDIHFVHQAMADDLVRGFLEKVERDEIIPVVPPVPGTDLGDYYRLIETRFANPRIGDTVQRLCLDGSNRQPKFILPSVADRLAEGGGIEGLALVSALWARYCYGETDSGAVIAPNDPDWERLQLQARRARRRPAAWLEMTEIYGEVAGNAVFAGAFQTALEALWRDGTRAVLGRYLGGGVG